MPLALTHAKYHFRETIRVPLTVAGTVFPPLIAVVCIVARTSRSAPTDSGFTFGAMAVFVTMSACLFHVGVAIAEDRTGEWGPFTRTLPTGHAPRFMGRAIHTGVMTLLCLIPVPLTRWAATGAAVTSPELIGLGTAVPITAIPFTLLGMAMGYLFTRRTASVVVSLVSVVMAAGGGLFNAGPDTAPAFLEPVASLLPTRGGVELVWAATVGSAPRPDALVVSGVWVIAAAAAAVWAFRRDRRRRGH